MADCAVAEVVDEDQVVLSPLGMRDARGCETRGVRPHSPPYRLSLLEALFFNPVVRSCPFAMDTGENAELLALQRIDETCMQLQQKVRWVPIPHDQ